MYFLRFFYFHVICAQTQCKLQILQVQEAALK